MLNGSDALQARKAAGAIAETLAGRTVGNDPSLGSGAAGIALMFGALADPRTVDLERWIDEAVQSEEFHSLGLHSGYAGLGLTIELLARRGLVSNDANGDIDELVRESVSGDAWPGELDLLAGVTGIGLYAIARGMSDAVQRIVGHLRAAATRDDDGAVWWTPYEWLPSGHRAMFPNGYANLGIAHGQPGVIAFLAQACAFDERARPLLDDAVRWLLAHRLEDGGFGRWAAPGYDAEPARLAWCYGDPGVAAALLVAADLTGESQWRDAAIDLALHAAARGGLENPPHIGLENPPHMQSGGLENPPHMQSGIVDAGFCHGAAGLAHIFNRMHQSTGVEALADAARGWYARTLALFHEGSGIGGFQSWQRADFDHPFQWVDDPGLLTGAAGIALALDAATQPVAPEWDAIFLLSPIA